MQFSDTFWLMLVGGFFGVVGVAFKSRCSRVSCCWGGLAVERDTHAEEHEAEMQMQIAARQPSVVANQV